MAQEKKTAKSIGLNVAVPEQSCNDQKCPFHGSLPVHGKLFTGTVKRARMQGSVVVEWEWRRFIPKYERYEKKTSRIKAHNPDCINAKEGDIVRIAETRPLSKKVNMVVVENVGSQKKNQ